MKKKNIIKKTAALLFAAAMIFVLSSCGSKDAETSTVPVTFPPETEEAMTGDFHDTVYIQINGGTKYAIKMEDSQSARLFEKMIGSSLEIDMTDYRTLGVTADIPQINASDSKNITAAPGDLVLYGNDQIIIFFNQDSFKYTKLGEFENFSAFLNDMPKNGFKATFSL